MKDLLLDNTGDLALEGENLIVGESTLQHQNLLLITTKGDWRENPLTGVGAAGFLKDELPGELLAEIKKEFEKDGMTVNSLSMGEELIKINAAYDE